MSEVTPTLPTGFVSPIRPDTYNNLQLNAGLFLVNFDASSYANATTLRAALAAAVTAGTTILGATRGGGQFVVQPEIREPDVDGKRYPFKGGKFVDSVDVYLSGTLVEINAANLARVMATGSASTSGQITTITMHTAIESGDYINKLTWIGDMSDGSLLMIELSNALNTNGVTLTFGDKNEGTLPFEFHAHQANVNDYATVPFKAYIIKPAA